ncbi:hypothetical protein DPMN_164653 [Dreissena polymorpha]|uniref:Uncharacterized protein n=1 Tax=Dreissena polymorpha TaxID=45954 RepID=A0A9D4ISJ2_DREPO|nr:hypothetical protein DPMN_164653 [Dreissena polymorpha]
MRPVSNATYNALVQMVKEKYKKAVRDRTWAEKNAAVLFWRKRDKLSIKVRNGKSILFHDKKRLVIQECMADMIRKKQLKFKDSGARSLAYDMKQKLSGISERKVRTVLDQSETHGHLNCKFTNKAPIKFVEANYVFKRVQIDLVKMSDVEFENRRFRYNLTLVDVFSRSTSRKKVFKLCFKSFKGCFWRARLAENRTI